ncbi:hypothetical protein [Aeromicrobium yanjiei]|nr:hypothetical protein [Aeromicrobium yanjiei]
MPGHSRGHAAVAVDAGDRGLFIHASDAAFDVTVLPGRDKRILDDLR